AGRKGGPAAATAAANGQAGGSGYALPRRRMRRWAWIAASFAAVAVIAAGFAYMLLRAPAERPSAAAASYVGSDTCGGCHRAEADLWRGAPHHPPPGHPPREKRVRGLQDRRFSAYSRGAARALPGGQLT